MVTKKVLISGLAIASLALTGCSDIQTAINNKIASTAKEVSGNINSEVAKTTDALKAQGEKMQSDFDQAGDELTQRKSYVSSLYNYAFKYPKDDTSIDAVGLENFSNGNEEFGVRVEGKKGLGKLFDISVLMTPSMSTLGTQTDAVRALFKTQDIRKIADRELAAVKKNANAKITQEVTEVTVAGVKAYQFTVSYSNLGTQKVIFVSDGKNLYRIDAPVNNAVSDAILASLTFLKK